MNALTHAQYRAKQRAAVALEMSLAFNISFSFFLTYNFQSWKEDYFLE